MSVYLWENAKRRDLIEAMLRKREAVKSARRVTDEIGFACEPVRPLTVSVKAEVDSILADCGFSASERATAVEPVVYRIDGEEV